MRRKRYTDAFKKQIIALVAQGRTPEQLSRGFCQNSLTKHELCELWTKTRFPKILK